MARRLSLPLNPALLPGRARRNPEYHPNMLIQHCFPTQLESIETPHSGCCKSHSRSELAYVHDCTPPHTHTPLLFFIDWSCSLVLLPSCLQVLSPGRIVRRCFRKWTISGKYWFKQKVSLCHFNHDGGAWINPQTNSRELMMLVSVLSNLMFSSVDRQAKASGIARVLW